MLYFIYINIILDFFYRFMIPIRVQDNTGTVTLTMFERDGKYLLKKSANELFKKAVQVVHHK